MNRFYDNPVLLKEFRGRMRGGKAFILLTVYLVLLSGLVGLILVSFTLAEQSTTSSTGISEYIGKILFWVVAGSELMMICFIAPALTAGAISSEHEHQTYDLLRTTLLSAKSLVFGKFTSAVSFLVLLLIVGFPLQSLAYLLGGVAIEEVLIAFLILVVTVLLFSAIGLFVSSFTRHNLVSTVVSYVIANMIVFGVPAFIYTALGFVAGTSLSLPNLTTLQETVITILLIILAWLFVAINPIATAIGTEVMLISEQSAIYANIALPNNWNFPLISPWIGYVIFYLLVSLLLIFLSVRFVKRVEK